MEFILNHITEIVFGLIGIVVLIGGIVAFIKATPAKRKAMIYDILYELAVRAEQTYGSKTGEIKKKAVVAQFYEKYPWLSFLISQTQLNDWIDEAVANMTVYFQKNTTAAMNVGIEIKSDDITNNTTEE